MKGPSRRCTARIAFCQTDQPATAACPQVLEAEQYGQHRFELAVEVDLAPAEPLKLVWVEGFPERLLTEQLMLGDFLSAIIEPAQQLALNEARQATAVGRGLLLALIQASGWGHSTGPITPFKVR